MTAAAVVALMSVRRADGGRSAPPAFLWIRDDIGEKRMPAYLSLYLYLSLSLSLSLSMFCVCALASYILITHLLPTRMSRTDQRLISKTYPSLIFPSDLWQGLGGLLGFSEFQGGGGGSVFSLPKVDFTTTGNVVVVA